MIDLQSSLNYQGSVRLLLPQRGRERRGFSLLDMQLLIYLGLKGLC
jgi:hypothetical protein